MTKNEFEKQDAFTAELIAAFDSGQLPPIVKPYMDWKRGVADIQDDGWTSHKDSIMNRNNIPLNCMGNIIRVVGNRIVSLTKEGCVENPVGMEVTDYFKERNQFLYENNPFIQVFIFSHDFLKR